MGEKGAGAPGRAAASSMLPGARHRDTAGSSGAVRGIFATPAPSTSALDSPPSLGLLPVTTQHLFPALMHIFCLSPGCHRGRCGPSSTPSLWVSAPRRPCPTAAPASPAPSLWVGIALLLVCKPC